MSKSHLPFVLVRSILRDRAVEIEAVVATLPAPPMMIKTPPLLNIVSGINWPPQMVSHTLIKLYLAIIFHGVADTEGRHRGPHFDIAYDTLKQQQRAAFGTLEKNGNASLFLLDYLNAYETIIIKFLHLLKVGGDVSIELGDDGQPPLSYFVLAMSGGAKEMFEELMSNEIVHGETVECDKVVAELTAMLEATTVDDA